MDFKSLDGVIVFVVDDNPNNLNVIKDHLKLNRLKPIPLKSGEAALELLDTMVPDIVLLDVQMNAGMDGFETCRQIKKKKCGKDIPILFISAFSDTVNKVTGFEAGGVDYITKPIDVQELLSRISVHITIKRLQNELYTVNQSLEQIIDERTQSLIAVNSSLSDEVDKHKKTEQELQVLQSFLSSILDSMPSMVLGVDQQGYVTQWNQAAQTKLAIPEKSASPKNFFDLCPEYKPDKDLLMKCIKTAQPYERKRKTVLRKKRTCYEELSIYPLISENQNGAVIYIEDITDKIMMEEMMIQNEKMLSTGGLAAGMAHEINNPLAGIMQAAMVMENRLGKKDIKGNHKVADELGISVEQIYTYMERRDIFNMLGGLIHSSKRLSGLVNNMLGFVRKGASTGEYVQMPFLLDTAIELASLDYNIRHHYDFKSIRIIKEYSTDLPMVFCEKSKIQQVFLNLLHNAAQAMIECKTPDPVIKLRIAECRDMESIQIEIQDNGPGMDEDTRKQIFEPFFTTKEPGRGTGLGLSVTYFIVVEHHRGEIRVESEPGHGTTFIITIPILRRE